MDGRLDLGSLGFTKTAKSTVKQSAKRKQRHYYNPTTSEDPDAIVPDEVTGCPPCSPGYFANGTARRVECDECPAKIVESANGYLEMQQTSEAGSTSAADCFAKFQSAQNKSFCYGKGSSIDSSGDASSDAKPLSEAARSTSTASNERCGQCRTMKKFCTCGLRRTTMDMAGKRNKKSSNTKSSSTSTAARSNPEGTICKQVTSTGPCQTTALPNTALCINHTCKEPACKLSKSAKVSYCKKHTATNTPALPATTLSTEYLDVAGSNV
eukprot:gene11791-29851_t